VRDMVLSLGVVLAVVAIVFLITLRQTPEAVKVIDAGPVLQAVQVNAPYPAVVPGTIEGWRITSARVSAPGESPFRWHVGYFTSTDRYAAAGQSSGSKQAYLNDERAGGTEVGTVRINGTTWTKIEREDGARRSLVRSADGVTTLVTGGGDFDELATLAKTLRPVKAAASPTPSN